MFDDVDPSAVEGASSFSGSDILHEIKKSITDELGTLAVQIGSVNDDCTVYIKCQRLLEHLL